MTGRANHPGAATLSLARSTNGLEVQASVDHLLPTSVAGLYMLPFFDYAAAIAAAATGMLTSGQPHMVGMALPAGLRTYGAVFLSGGAAAVAPTNQFAFLTNSSRVPVAVSADLTNTAWAANSAQQFAWTEYVIPSDGWYRVGLSVTAGTPPTLRGANPGTALTGFGSAFGFPPRSGQSSSTGLTTPASLPNPVGSATATTGAPWGGLIVALPN